MVDQDTIHQEFKEVKIKYPDLELLCGEGGAWKVFGSLHFRGSFMGEVIEDVYSVLISISKNYPKVLPTVRELDGRIPKEFHTSYDDSLCLGTPLLVKMRFYERPNLLGFIEACLVEYFYGYNYFQKHGILPVGEFDHNINGILEHYQELFGTEKYDIVIGLLIILANDSYRGHIKCVCGSGKRLRNCHGKILLELRKYQTPIEYQTDMEAIMELLRKKDKIINY